MLKPLGTGGNLLVSNEKSRVGSSASFTGQVNLKHVKSGLKPLNALPYNQNLTKAADQPFQKYGDRERRMSRCVPLRRPLDFIKRVPSEKIETPEPEEILDDEILFSRLQKMFIFAEEEGKTGLDIAEFKDAMRKTVGRNNTEDEIELLFMKVDANCDGVVDWEEYVTYNLLEYKEKTLMIEMLREKPFPNEIREVDSRHRETIVRICLHPNVRKTGSKSGQLDYKHGKYITLSKEGTLGIWSLSMKNLKYHNANHYQDRKTQPWFTDMVVMYNVNMLAISSTDRDITIFDLAGKKFSMRYYVTGLENCITSMDYWADKKDLDIAILLFGDTSGSVFSVKFESALRGGPFGAVSGKKNACKRVSFPEVTRGYVIGVKSLKFPNIHEDWVNKVQYLPDINCFLSSCQSPHTALFFGDLVGKKSHVYFKVNKGVLSFDYSPSLNIIVTGGMDYMLRVWNPYVNNKAIVLLKGHTKPVNHVLINDKKNQVISIDKGRSLRVFDLRDQTCLQHISGRLIKFDPFPISAVYFNVSMRTTILAANQLVILEKREEEERYSEILSHTKPVVGAIYSKVFNSVVTACQDSVVSIWDTNNGDKLMQFVNAHCRTERGVEIPVEITALCFDHNGRRLVTGARNGTVHMWNFNNGSCLQKFELPDNSDVTGIVCTKHRLYVTGWGKTVHIYVDGGGEEHRKSWKMQHKEDILSIAYMSPNIIATGGYDGNVIIWSRETGQVYCCLNAFENVKPITENTAHVSKGVATAGINRVSSSQQTVGSTLDEEETQQYFNWNKKKKKISGAMTAVTIVGRYRDSAGNEHVKSGKEKEEEKCEHPLLQAIAPDSFNSLERNRYTRDDYDNVCKRYESAVERILFLETRESLQKDAAVIVTSGAEGWVRFWSMHHEGGLLGQFNASHSLGESVLAMKSDLHNHFLITGDTQGYVKVWNIKYFCSGKKFSLAEKKEYIDNLRRKFTFFRVETYEEKKYKETVLSHLKNVFALRPPPASSEPDRTLKYPLLVNSFRAHVCSIHTVDYVTDREILITASADCSVRLWTVNGQYIGTFGEHWKPLPKVVTAEYFIAQIPADIRRSGSARTLKVMNAGKTPLWHSAISLIKQRGIKRLKKQFEHLQTREEEEENERQPSTSSVESSNILGKSYKRTMNHRMRPNLPKFIETPGSVAVYHTLPFSDLSPVDALNKTIKEIQARRVGAFALGKLRGTHKKKSDQPAIINVFNKVVNKPGPTVKRYGPANRMKKVAEKFQGFPNGQRSPDQKTAKKQKEHVNNKEAKETKAALESGDASRVSIDEPETDEEDAQIVRRGSNTSGCSPTGSKVEFKLPSIVE